MKNYIIIFILLTSLSCSQRTKKLDSQGYTIIKEIMKKQKKYKVSGGGYDNILRFGFLVEDSIQYKIREDSAIARLDIICYENCFEDIYKLKNLISLSIKNVKTMPDLSKFPKLKFFYIEFEKNSDYFDFSFKNLEKVFLNRANINSFSFSNIKDITLYNSNIKNDFEIKNDSRLEKLRICYNNSKLKKISVKSMHALKILEISRLHLKEIELDNLPIISKIYLGRECLDDNIKDKERCFDKNTILKIKQKFKPGVVFEYEKY